MQGMVQDNNISPNNARMITARQQVKASRQPRENLRQVCANFGGVAQIAGCTVSFTHSLLPTTDCGVEVLRGLVGVSPTWLCARGVPWKKTPNLKPPPPNSPVRPAVYFFTRSRALIVRQNNEKLYSTLSHSTSARIAAHSRLSAHECKNCTHSRLSADKKKDFKSRNLFKTFVFYFLFVAPSSNHLLGGVGGWGGDINVVGTSSGVTSTGTRQREVLAGGTG